MDSKLVWSLAASIVGLSLSTALVRIVVKMWWRPLQTKKFFESQGIGGPPYKLFQYGNEKEVIEMNQKAKSTPMDLCHDIVPRVLPQIHAWTKAYGRVFLFWFGPSPRLVIPYPELIKELLSNKFGHYEKTPLTKEGRQLIGDGLASSEGEKWVGQRRLINPAFHAESLKSMFPIVVASAASMLDNWRSSVISGQEEIEVSNEFRCLTADIIARTAFGSSYVQGKNVFDMQAEQSTVIIKKFSKFNFISAICFLPTRNNLRAEKLDREIQRSLRQLIFNRENNVKMGKEDNYGTDLLGLMMAANKKEMNGDKKHLIMSIQDIVDNCKTFFFAGHETSSLLLTLTMILLGMHTDWQERARKEVLDFCKKEYPNAEVLARLKIVNMIIHETLRLYPPVTMLTRQTYKQMKLGDLIIPVGTEVLLPIATVHHDEELWGKDANDFNPERFSEGVSKAARHPMAFMPFGLGPRICVGQNFAFIEAKIVLVMILQRFSFVLSPAYAHAPAPILTLRPQHGAQIILRQLSLE
eukprot:Gb_35763 [translate_table: standard]